MLRSSLGDCSDTYILVERTITVAQDQSRNVTIKNVILKATIKNCE